MLRLPPFRLRRPRSLGEALEIIAGEGPGCRLLAGGTDLLPNMKRRHQKAKTMVSLMGVPELAGITGRADGGVEIGATTTLHDLACHPLLRKRYPGLVTAVESISSPPLRFMGTIGGNLCVDTRCTYYNQTEEWRRSIDYCMKEEGEICWVATSSPRCWAHSASDAAPMLSALGATVTVTSADRQRQIPVAELYRDDGIDYLAKRPDEILTSVALPGAASAPDCRSAFWKLRRRGSIDFGVLSAAVALWVDDDEISQAAIYLGGVASLPREAKRAAQSLAGARLEPEPLAEAAALAGKAATPMDNTDFQAQWRKAIASRYVEAALRQAAGLPQERLAPRHQLHRAS